MFYVSWSIEVPEEGFQQCVAMILLYMKDSGEQRESSDPKTRLSSEATRGMMPPCKLTEASAAAEGAGSTNGRHRAGDPQASCVNNLRMGSSPPKPRRALPMLPVLLRTMSRIEDEELFPWHIRQRGWVPGPGPLLYPPSSSLTVA